MASAEELMIQFYGLKEVDTRDLLNPDDINSKSFKPKQHYHKIIKTENLQSIIKKGNMLTIEKNNLENNMESLIKQNITVFVDAEKTLKTLQNGLEEITRTMTNVGNELNNINNHTNELKENLREKYESLQDCCGMNRLLQKIDFIVSLPYKIRAYCNENQFEKAIEHWLPAKDILDNPCCKHATFENIKRECIEVFENRKVEIRNVVINDQSSVSAALSAAYSLLMLNEDSECILSELIRYRLVYISNKMDKELPEKYQERLAYIENEVMPFSNRFIKDFTTIAAISKEYSDYITSFKEKLFKLIKDKFDINLVFSEKAEVFKSFVKEFDKIVKPISSYKDTIGLVGGFYQKFIENRFECFANSLIELVKNATKEDDEIFTTFKNTFLTQLNDLFAELSVFKESDDTDSGDYVIQESSNLFIRLVNMFEDLVPQHYIVVILICNYFAESAISEVFKLSSNFEPNSQLLELRGVCISEVRKAGQNYLRRFIENKREFLVDISTEGLFITSWYNYKNQEVTAQISTFIKIIVEDLESVYSTLDKLLIVNDGSNTSRSSSVHKSLLTKSRSFATSSALGLSKTIISGHRESSVHQIDKLFTTINRLKLSLIPDLCRGNGPRDIVASILFYIIKSMLEYVRTETFSYDAYKQIHEDYEYIYNKLSPFIDDRMFKELIEEVLSSVAARTLEPDSVLRNDSILKDD